MFPRGGFGSDASIGPEPASSNPFQVSIVRSDGAVANRYQRADVGPAASGAFVVFAVGRYTGGVNRTFWDRGDILNPLVDGYYGLQMDGGAVLSWLLSNGGVVQSSSGIALALTVLNTGFFTSALRVSAGNLAHFFQGRLLGAPALTGAVQAIGAGELTTALARGDLGAGTTLLYGSGLLGFGGRSGAVPTDNEIMDWHDACVDQFACAPFPGETHHWDARDQNPTTAVWTDRVAGQGLDRAGAPSIKVQVPVWVP